MNAAPAPPPAPSRSVLLVEDNVLVSLTTADMLEELGYAVHHASDAKTALVHLAQNSDIALIIADVGLPDMSGYHLANRARRRHPGLRVLFTTGYEETPDRIPSDAVTAYLQKPYQPASLGAALARLLAA